MQSYTPAKIQQVLRFADNDRNGQGWYLALSGIRRGELAGLRWPGVDFVAHTLTIRNNRVQASTVLDGPTNSSSSRRTFTDRRRACGRAETRSACFVVVLHRGERGGGPVHAGLAYAHVAKDDEGGWRSTDPGAQCAPYNCDSGAPPERTRAVIVKLDRARRASTTARLYAHGQDGALKDAAGILGIVVTSGVTTRRPSLSELQQTFSDLCL